MVWLIQSETGGKGEILKSKSYKSYKHAVVVETSTRILDERKHSPKKQITFILPLTHPHAN